MNRIESFVIRLQSWVQEEIAAQGRLLEHLERQERAVLAGRTDEVAATGSALEGELATRPARDRRRREMVGALGAALGVPAATLTLGSLAERIESRGMDASRLRALRDELRTRVAEVLRRTRRIAALARHHQGILGDLIGILTDADADEERPQGVLVDAEA